MASALALLNVRAIALHDSEVALADLVCSFLELFGSGPLVVLGLGHAVTLPDRLDVGRLLGDRP